MMGPLIDAKLQKIDQKHAVLEDLNLKILEAFQVYNNLMKESISKNTNMIYSSSSTMGQLNSISAQQPQQQLPLNPGQQISYAAAPPNIDPSSMLLANQLNSLAVSGAAAQLPQQSTLANGMMPQAPQGYAMPVNGGGYSLDPNQQMLQQQQQINPTYQMPNNSGQMYAAAGNIVPKLETSMTHSTSGGQLNGYNYTAPYQN
jgi:hypothetical protein